MPSSLVLWLSSVIKISEIKIVPRKCMSNKIHEKHWSSCNVTDVDNHLTMYTVISLLLAPVVSSKHVLIEIHRIKVTFCG